MHAPRYRSLLPRHRAVWLLWLALLLPVAQWAAQAHAFAHVPGRASSQVSSHLDADAAVQAGACDLCLAAAALAGTAPPNGQARPPTLAGPDAAPIARTAGAWPGRAGLAYRSRAPPFPVL